MKTQKIIILAAFAGLLFVLKGEFPVSRENTSASKGISVSVPYFVFPPAFPASSSESQAAVAAGGARSLSPAIARQEGNMSAVAPADEAVSPVQSAQPGPTVGAEAAYLGDISSGKEFYALNAEKHWPLASLTKLMTAAVALEHFSVNDVITIAPDAFQMSATTPDEAALRVGERYRMKDILAMALLPSSNKAADALAAAVGRTQFVSEMNSQAPAWGMNDTHFEEPTGLSVLNQSTARDLAVLASSIYRTYPQIFALTREPRYTATELQSGRQTDVKSINTFAGQSDFLGGKTGYTDEADGNLLSLFLYRNSPVACIVMGTPDRFGETTKLMHWLKSTAQGG